VGAKTGKIARDRFSHAGGEECRFRFAKRGKLESVGANGSHQAGCMGKRSLRKTFPAGYRRQAANPRQTSTPLDLPAVNHTSALQAAALLLHTPDKPWPEFFKFRREKWFRAVGRKTFHQTVRSIPFRLAEESGGLGIQSPATSLNRCAVHAPRINSGRKGPNAPVVGQTTT